MKDLWNNSFSSLPVLIGELNFDSTLTGHFWNPDEKMFSTKPALD